MEDHGAAADVLARARRALSPSAGDAARVRRALGATLAGGGAATEPTASAARPPSSRWTSRLLVAGAIAAASGGAGYWVGHRAGAREALRESRARPAMPMPAVEGRRPVAEPPSAASPTAPPALPSLVPAHHEARHAVGKAARTQTDSLEIEMRALRNAERALRDANPGLALAFLDELDRQVPRGQLTEEREAAATLARCARGDHPFGVDLGAEFIERHPASVYRARVEQACGATDFAHPGDPRSRRP